MGFKVTWNGVSGCQKYLFKDTDLLRSHILKKIQKSLSPFSLLQLEVSLTTSLNSTYPEAAAALAAGSPGRWSQLSSSPISILSAPSPRHSEETWATPAAFAFPVWNLVKPCQHRPLPTPNLFPCTGHHEKAVQELQLAFQIILHDDKAESLWLRIKEKPTRLMGFFQQGSYNFQQSDSFSLRTSGLLS